MTPTIPHLRIVVGVSVSLGPIRGIAANVRNGLMRNTVLLSERLAHTPPFRGGADGLHLLDTKLAVRSCGLGSMQRFVGLVVAMARPTKIIRVAISRIAVNVSNLMLRGRLRATVGRTNDPVDQPLNDLTFVAKSNGRVAVLEPRLHQFPRARSGACDGADNGAVSINHIFGRIGDDLRFRDNHARILPQYGEIGKV